jgi:phosphatidate phosphatase APP1
VSASPWQFYAPLSDFISSNGFPAGFFSLKQVRWKDRSLFSLFESPDAYKIKAIEQILDRLPRRQVMLVGDSGERDPEIYATLARRHPKQIRRIFIRDVTNETANSPRYQQAFRDLSPDLWQIFSEPASLQSRSMP